MIRSIVLTGSECTGKSTLARALAQRLQAPLVAEYAREYAHRQLPRGLDDTDVWPIAHGQRASQLRGEAEARARGAGAVVLDTDLLSTWTYSQVYYGHAPDALADWVRTHRGHLYLLCSHQNVPWQHDGIRDREGQRDAMQAAFVGALADFQCSTVTLAGTPDERLELALLAL